MCIMKTLEGDAWMHVARVSSTSPSLALRRVGAWTLDLGVREPSLAARVSVLYRELYRRIDYKHIDEDPQRHEYHSTDQLLQWQYLSSLLLHQSSFLY